MSSIVCEKDPKHSRLLQAINYFDSLSGYLIIFGLAGGGIANVLLYYFGIHGTPLRAPLFVLAAVMVFFLAGIRLMQIYITNFQCRRQLLLSLIFPICGLLVFVGSFAIFGRITDGNIDFLMKFGCFCIPAFIFGLDCALNHRELTLFRTLNMVSVFYVPFAVFCIFAVFSPSNVSGVLALIGDFNYMSIAYVFLLPLAFLVICFVLIPDRLFLSLNADSFRKINSIICFGLALIFWYVILCTGTRGPMVCVFGSVVFLIIWTAFIRNKRSFIRSVAVLLTFTLIFTLFMFVINSENTSSASGRMQYFIENLLHGKFKTSSVEGVGQADLDKIIINKETKTSHNIEEREKPLDPSSHNIEEREKPLDPSKIVMKREQLYYAAVGEFLNSPVYGMGPLGFHTKYNKYVHNIVLEVLCDYGIIGALLFFGVCLWLFVRIVKSSLNNIISGAMLVIIVCMNLPLLVSSVFITWPPFWFFLGYAGLTNVNIKYRKATQE